MAKSCQTNHSAIQLAGIRLAVLLAGSMTGQTVLVERLVGLLPVCRAGQYFDIITYRRL